MGNIFFFFHIYGSLVLIIALMYHTKISWYFMIPGISIQFYDRLWRLWNSSNCNSINIISLKQCSTDVARLRININNQHPNTKLCGWYNISIPHISPFQWHPFSISNALNSSFTEFHIKNIGNFSSSILNLSSLANIRGQRLSLNKMDILIEGPFGVDIDFHGYHRLVLIAGGIGITPIHNLFFTLFDQTLSNTQNRYNIDKIYIHQLPSIDLIWIARYADIFEIYKKSFNKYISSNLPNMKISLYATREQVRYPSTCNASIDDDDEEPLTIEDEQDDKLSIHVSNSSVANKSFNIPLHSSMNNIIDKKKKRKKKSRNKKRNNEKDNKLSVHSISSNSRYATTRDVDCPIKWKIGRPDLYQELRYLDQLKNKAIIYCCGPSNLVQTCQELAFLYGNHFKKEAFIW